MQMLTQGRGGGGGAYTCIHNITGGISNFWLHTLGTGRHANLVVDQDVLEHGADNVTAGNVVAGLDASGLKVPLLLTVQGGHIDAAGDVDGLCFLQRGMEGMVGQSALAYEAGGKGVTSACISFSGIEAVRSAEKRTMRRVAKE